jgi:hypothetical protein
MQFNNGANELTNITNFFDILIGDYTSFSTFIPIINDSTVTVEFFFDSNMLIELSSLCFGYIVNNERRKLASLFYVLSNYSNCKILSYYRHILLEYVASNSNKISQSVCEKRRNEFQRLSETAYNIPNIIKSNLFIDIAFNKTDRLADSDLSFNYWTEYSDIPQWENNYPEDLLDKYLMWFNNIALIGTINRKNNLSGIEKLRIYLSKVVKTGKEPSIDAIWAIRVFCGRTKGCKKNFACNNDLDLAKKNVFNQTWDFFVIAEYIKILFNHNPDKYGYLVTADVDMKETIKPFLAFVGDNYENILMDCLNLWCGNSATKIRLMLKELLGW